MNIGNNIMTPELREQLLDLVPQRFHNDLAVAGGYVADPALANDIDLWVMDVKPEDFLAVEAEIRRHLFKQALLSNPAAPERDDLHYEAFDDSFRVVSCQQVTLNDHEAEETYAVPVQIIIAKQENLTSLVERFDISTHAIGVYVSEPSCIVKGLGFTPTDEQPRVLTFSRPHQTLARLQRIAPRYKFEALPSDLLQLEAACEECDGEGWLEVA